MKDNQTFAAVMNVLWGNLDDPKSGTLGQILDGAPRPAVSAIVRALASFVKNHRVNHENAFEVLCLLWPTARMSLRKLEDGDEPFSDDPSEAIFDLVFEDGSQAMVISKRAIGDQVEVL
jgi:hypothetical protein